MHRTIVGVVRGGPSPEFDISLKTGAAVLTNLPEEKYKAIDIFVDKQGTWHHRGLPIKPEDVLQQVDVIFNAFHGEYGEDGKVQRFLDTFGVPYTGSGVLASAVAMNKLTAKEHLAESGITMAEHIVLDVSDTLEDDVRRIAENIPGKVVVKPLSAGSSLGVSVGHTYDEILPAVYKAFEYSPQVLIEEYIQGKEATCGVTEHFRGKPLYAMIPIEICLPKASALFDYDVKYGEETGLVEICPGNFTPEESEALQHYATLIHTVLGLRHYSRSDFIIGKDGSIYFLEVNTLPGLTEASLVPKSLKAAGCTFPEFLDHLVMLALAK